MGLRPHVYGHINDICFFLYTALGYHLKILQFFLNKYGFILWVGDCHFSNLRTEKNLIQKKTKNYTFGLQVKIYDKILWFWHQSLNVHENGTCTWAAIQLSESRYLYLHFFTLLICKGLIGSQNQMKLSSLKNWHFEMVPNKIMKAWNNILRWSRWDFDGVMVIVVCN